MFEQEQVLEGVVAYMKRELIPILPGYAKVLGGAVLAHNSQRIGNILTSLTTGGMARTLDIVTADGKIDVDVWAQNIKESIREYGSGKMEIQLPMLQPIIISESDVDTLRRYIRGELR